MKTRSKKRYWQMLKSLSFERFWTQLNIWHTNAYLLAVSHYQEAMDATLTPSQKALVVAKAKEIRELWDGIQTVSTDEVDQELFKRFGEGD